MPKSPLKPKKCKKKSKKRPKNAKTHKVQKLRIDPSSSPPHPTQKNDKKTTKSTVYCKKKVGRSENQPKKHKKCDFSKRARQKILKIGKIHVIYVYIKNQKQTDELPKSQVACVLGEFTQIAICRKILVFVLFFGLKYSPVLFFTLFPSLGIWNIGNLKYIDNSL